MYTTLWNIVDNPVTNPSFFDVLMHPLDGPFYWERSAYARYDRIHVPFYTRSAWWAYAHMHLTGTFRHWAGIDAPTKLEIDRPVDEARPLERSYDEEVVRWYDHWLKGVDTGVMDEPPIRLYLMGAETWRQEHEWPLARTEWTRLYLRRGRRAGTEPAQTDPTPSCRSRSETRARSPSSRTRPRRSRPTSR